MRWRWIGGIAVFAVLFVVGIVYIFIATYDYNKMKPDIARAVKGATGRELSIGGNIHLHIGLTLSLVLEDVSLQNAPWGSRPELAKIRSFALSVALIPLIMRRIEIKSIALIEPDILIESDKNGRSNLAFEGEKGTAPEEKKEKKGGASPLAFAINKMRIDQGRLSYRIGQTGKTFTVSLKSLIASAPDWQSPVRMEIEGSYNDELFKASCALGPVDALLHPERAWPIDLKAEAFGYECTFEGTAIDLLAQKGIHANFIIKGQGIPSSTHIKGPVEVSGRLEDTGPRIYKISNLNIAALESDLKGFLDVDLTGARVYVEGTLTSQRLDIRPFMQKEKGDGAPDYEKRQKRDKIFSKGPLHIDNLKKADATIKIAINRILMPKVVIDNLSAHIALKDGQVTIKPVEALIGGGRLDGYCVLSQLNTEIKIVIRQLDIGLMLKELKVTETIYGKLDIDTDLKGKGDSLSALMGGLNGNVSCVMSEGRIDNKYIALLGSDFRSGVFRLLNPFGQESEYTDINCFVTRFDVKNGLADVTAMVFDTGYMSVIGSGSIDLRDERLDLSLRPVPKEGIGSNTIGKISLSLGELAKPFKLGGTLAQPSLSIDSKQVALTLGKAIGGAALFGPAGIAAALISGNQGDENPCLAALEAAKSGVKMPAKVEGDKSPAPLKPSEEFTDGVKDIEKGIKRLFGR